jgi:uncharacterized membrane protein HdeD (DUF308 family)
MEQRFKITAQAFDLCSLGPNWWLFALRGILALGFGGLAVSMPIETVLAMTIVFGAYATVDGVFHLVSGINQAHKRRRWGGLVSSGILGIAAGLIMLVSPHLATLGLTLLLWATVAAWAIATGIALIAASIRLRREIQEEWLMTLNGVILVLLGLGVLLMFKLNPAASIVSLGFFVSLAAISSGVVNLLLAFKLRKDEGPVQSSAKA